MNKNALLIQTISTKIKFSPRNLTKFIWIYLKNA